MKEQKFGHIVNTGSVAGLLPLSLSTSYTASKYAVVGLSTSLRVEHKIFKKTGGGQPYLLTVQSSVDTMRAHRE